MIRGILGWNRLWLLLAATLLVGLMSRVPHAAEREFRIRFSQDVHKENYTGRVYVFTGGSRGEPRQGPNWFRPSPFVALDVEDWQPETSLTITAETPGLLAFPQPLSQLSLDGQQVQAVIRFNPWERRVGTGPGNGFSAVVKLNTGDQDETVDLSVNQLVPAREFQETANKKLLRVRSERLSTFHDRDVFLHAAVDLPSGYHADSKKRYPVIFEVPGFGGTHFDQFHNADAPDPELGGVKFIRILLDPSCPLGHHVFADSANNGPYGAALVHELIPELDRQYRTIAQPGARFLTGHSSGGWSTLWLQVTYPDTFGGTWSTSPDPVDFRDFQQINLYQPSENMYVDSEGQSRPLARMQGQPVIWYRDFAQMEWVLGYGGQLHSFEAVFSPQAASGTPQLLWDRKSGEIDTDVAQAWQAYDIRKQLERNWERLGPKLAGKLHVIMGEQDSFYLEGSTRLLKESIANLTDEPIVTLMPGYTHFDILTPQLRNQMRQQMVDSFLQNFPQGD